MKIENVSPGEITTITINHDTSKPRVGETGADIFFSIDVPHSVPGNGSITIYFPLQPVSNIHTVDSPVCNQSGGTLSGSLSCTYDTGTQLLTLSSLSGSLVTGELNWTVSGIINPISTATVSGLEIKTLTDDGGEIDTGTGSWSVPDAAIISSATWTVGGNTTVSGNGNHVFQFPLTFPVEANAEAEIIFPSDITFGSSLISLGGLDLFGDGSTFLIRTSPTVRLRCRNTTLDASSSNALILNTITNPNKLKDTDSATINIYTSSGDPIASISSGLILSSSGLTNGEVNIVSVTPTVTTVQTNSVGYSFVFNPGKFRIKKSLIFLFSKPIS